MDIVTQGIIGALAAQAIADEKNSRRATWIGFFAGLPADADILISSQTDPLLTLDFH
ncbi:MAG: metal-dependent hydrolase, partial [Magnetococcales bacterium]|nr:metal-dependent hydrolase [Magnetococcales bacterium]